MPSPSGSADYFAQLSQELMGTQAALTTAEDVVRRASEVVTACDTASITIRQRGDRMATIAASSEQARRCDQVQYDLSEGPCVDSLRGSPLHISGDLAHEPQWRTWGPRAAQEGVHSVLSIQLSTDATVIGALNMYSLRLHAFDNDQLDLALVYAIHAANAIATSQQIEGLRIAVGSRHEIGIAQGILMQLYSLDQDQSFEVLRRYSSRLNLKLRAVAVHVIHHRTLPTTREEVDASL